MNKILLLGFVLFSTTLFAQSWKEQGNAIDGRHHPISFSLNGKGYAVTGTSSLGQPTDDVYEYNPDTDTWSSLADFPGTARSFGIGTVTNGIAYLGLGATTRQYLNDFWSFDASDSSWTQLASCGCSGRRHPAMIGIGTRIYVGLGDDATGNLKDWWMYDITANTWTQIADLPGPERHHPYMFNVDGKVFAGLGHGSNAFGQIVYKDWYRLDTSLNTWSAVNDFPGQGRVAGTQFGADGYGFVLSGDGNNHSFMETGEMWRYDPDMDNWMELIPHPGLSRWAPGSFVIDTDVYFFGGLNRFTNSFPDDVWKYDLTDTTTGIEEEKLILSNTYVYPNPANDFLLWENDKSITDVKVYNTLGKLVLTSTARAKKINTTQFNSGLYLVQFYIDSELIKTSKVLIQH